MWVADTSWLYAFLHRGDARHRDAYQQMEEPSPVRVPPTILAETLDLLKRRHGKDVAVQAWGILSSLPHLQIGSAEPTKEALAIWERNPPLSLADAVAVADALRAGAGLRTFGDAQRKALAAEARKS